MCNDDKKVEIITTICSFDGTFKMLSPYPSKPYTFVNKIENLVALLKLIYTYSVQFVLLLFIINKFISSVVCCVLCTCACSVCAVRNTAN